MDAVRQQLDELMGKDRNLLVCSYLLYIDFLDIDLYLEISPMKKREGVCTSVTQMYVRTISVDSAHLSSLQTLKVI